MSARAIRRAQKELEERRQLEQLRDEDEEEEEEETAPAPKAHASLFSLLEDTGDAEESEKEESEGENTIQTEVAPPPPSVARKSKKKKKKGKAKVTAQHDVPLAVQSTSGLDDIDRALLALDLVQSKSTIHSTQIAPAISDELHHLYSVLSVDPQHLQAANEMRKLFGRAAVQNNNEDEPRARARGHGQHAAGAAAAMAQRGAAPRTLSTLQRRNIFIPGKEDWPQATTGGLGMELVERHENGTVQYRFVHSSAYQAVQKQFETCVASMDPERMIQLLHHNPYHISTLLQVSEIAKQQRDNATAGDLLERTLFSFGRAVHSTFKDSLSQGKARLDFSRPENREFWLAASRYVAQLGVRATWRTAFEWAKLILSLAPEEDPYCVRLSLIDQTALRGREAQQLIDLVESDHLQRAWKMPPNLAFSIAIAYDRMKSPEKARKSLRLAIKEYPWIAARLCKELEINPIPKAIWGKEPNDDQQELLCQIYVPRAKDLWNTPEATSLLMEVASSFDQLGAGEDPYWLAKIDEIDLARHVILTDDRELLSLIDPRIKNQYTSTSDPLPPKNSKPSYTLDAPTTSRSPPLTEAEILLEQEELRSYFNRVGMVLEDPTMTQEQFLAHLRGVNTTHTEFRSFVERIQVLRNMLQERAFRAEAVEGSESDD